MTMTQDTADLKDQARRLGADFVGIADAAGFLSPDYTGNKPQDFMPGIRSVIVIGVVIPKGCVQPLPRGRPEYTNTLMAGTATLRVIAFRLARDLEKQGYLAALVPTEGSEFGMWYADRETLEGGYLPEVCRMACRPRFIRPQPAASSPAETGPRIRMTAILTDAPLSADHPAEATLRPARVRRVPAVREGLPGWCDLSRRDLPAPGLPGLHVLDAGRPAVRHVPPGLPVVDLF